MLELNYWHWDKCSDLDFFPNVFISNGEKNGRVGAHL